MEVLLNKKNIEILANRVLLGTKAYSGLDKDYANVLESYLKDPSTGTIREILSIYYSYAKPFVPSCNSIPKYDAIRDTGRFAFKN